MKNKEANMANKETKGGGLKDNVHPKDRKALRRRGRARLRQADWKECLQDEMDEAGTKALIAQTIRERLDAGAFNVIKALPIEVEP